MAKIEKHSSEWQIEALGVSITTMEEVFLKVTEMADEKIKKTDHIHEGLQLQIYILMKKNFKNHNFLQLVRSNHQN